MERKAVLKKSSRCRRTVKIRERVWTREIWRFAPSVLYVDQEKICDPPSLMTRQSAGGGRTEKRRYER